MTVKPIATALALILSTQLANAQERVFISSAPSPDEYAEMLGIDIDPNKRIQTRGIQMLENTVTAVPASPMVRPAPAPAPMPAPAAPSVVAPSAPVPSAGSPVAPASKPIEPVRPVRPSQPKPETSVKPQPEPKAEPKPSKAPVIIAAPVNFALDSSEIPESFKPHLINLATVLRAPDAQDKVLIITGHTDSQGDEDYNLGLSKRRANAVKAYLIGLGVDPRQLVSEGKGETELIEGEETNHPLNRRVEFRIAG